MVRWQPGTRERLQRAALRLFGERGYDGVTVAQIAEAAGLTERTFFRWFADKPEVLFTGQAELEQTFLGPLAAAGEPPMTRVMRAVEAAAATFPDERRPLSRARQDVIDGDPRLQERELLKLAALTAALSRGLQEGGADPTTAALAAEAGVAVFRIAFAAWIADGETRSLVDVQHRVFAEQRALIGGPPA